MAEVLSKWPGDLKRGRYPWHLWLDGQIWKLVQGDDFDKPPACVRIAAQSYARCRQWRIATRISNGNTLVIQRLGVDDSPAAAERKVDG